MTTPGAPTSPGLPLLEPAAQHTIAAAQARVAAMTGRAPLPPQKLTEKEREEALKDAASTACLFCASLHPGASTPACPRLAMFKLNGDGMVIEGSFWPDGITDTTVEQIGDDEKTKTVTHTRSDWDTSKVVPVADVAEEDEAEAVADG